MHTPIPRAATPAFRQEYNILAPPPPYPILSSSKPHRHHPRQHHEAEEEEVKLGGGRRRAEASKSIPSPYPSSLPLSEYDIINEVDPKVKARLQAQYAQIVNEAWKRQAEEKEELAGMLKGHEGRGWPFQPTGAPMDKRGHDTIVISQPSSPRGLGMPR